MTNYATSPLFQDNLSQLWGQQSRNLPNVIAGPYSGELSEYSAGGANPVGIWDWMNHHQQMRSRSDDDFAYLIIDIGKDDFTIDYATQGRPLIQALTDGKIPFAAVLADGVDHEWRGYNAVNVNQFGLSESNTIPWHYPNSSSLIAVQNATGSGSTEPSAVGDDEYNINIEWSAGGNSFHLPIVDQSNRFEVSLRSSIDQTASITPRNTSAFRPLSGQQCGWSATRISNSQVIGSGVSTVDANALLTAFQVPIVSGQGSRLTIICE